VLLQAFAQVCGNGRRDDKGPVLVLVGDGPQAGEYRELAGKLRLDGRILFRGALPSAAIGSVLTCCHVLALPSRFDGWGVVVNEAASAGLALVVSDRCGAAYHVLEPGLNGLRVRAGSISSLAAAMHVYARDPNVAQLHGGHSLARFEQFTPDANAHRFISSIRGWLAGAALWERWHTQWSRRTKILQIRRAA
jgi:glycosyltransferase involved in cell wall biosynthesis